MINNKYKHSELTGRIIGCVMEAHHPGNGFQKVICQKALENEFTPRNVNHAREYEMHVFYKGKPWNSE